MGMKKLFIFISTLLSTVFYTQKCTDLQQSINSNGHFNISFTEKLFDSFSETIPEIINIEETSQDNLKVFQNKFPDIYDGKCLKINIKGESTDFFFCDKDQRDQIPKDRNNTFGKFKLMSKIDNFYFFKYSGFEIGGYLMYNVKDRLFYFFVSKPIISQDKKIIYSYHNGNYCFELNILNLDNYNELTYHLNGDFNIKDLKLTQLKNTDRYSVIIDLIQKIIIRDQENNITETQYCDRKIKIN